MSDHYKTRRDLISENERLKSTQETLNATVQQLLTARKALERDSVTIAQLKLDNERLARRITEIEHENKSLSSQTQNLGKRTLQAEHEATKAKDRATDLARSLGNAADIIKDLTHQFQID